MYKKIITNRSPQHYFYTELGELYQGDCLKVMPLIDKVDYTITSPPYNLGKPILGVKTRRDRESVYEEYHDNLPMKDYAKLLRSSINLMLKVTRHQVFLIIQMVAGNKPALFKTIGDFSYNIKEMIIWDKKHTAPAMAANVMNSAFEFIIVFSSKKDAKSRAFKNARFKKSSLDNILRLPGNKGNRYADHHKAVFPEHVPYAIINNFTKKGDTILDPFIGIGTTASVCEMSNRRWVGIELSETSCSIAKKEIENTVKHCKTRLF